MPRLPSAAAASVALLLGAAPGRAERFVVATSFDKSDTSCSTWERTDILGVQDACLKFSDNASSSYGFDTPVTGKLYEKVTCSGGEVHRRWYSDAGCTDLLPGGPGPTNFTQACHFSSGLRAYMKYECDVEYPAATWSRFADGAACEIRDRTQVVPVGFCEASTSSNFEWSTKARQVTCTDEGFLETTHWENSDCTGSKVVKTEAGIPSECAKRNYYEDKHVRVESGCPVATSGASSAPLSGGLAVALALVALPRLLLGGRQDGL